MMMSFALVFCTLKIMELAPLLFVWVVFKVICAFSNELINKAKTLNIVFIFVFISFQYRDY